MSETLLDTLRVLNLSLLFIFVGVNLAIWKHHYEDLTRLVIVGRSGLALAVALSLVSRLTDLPQRITNILFNVLLCVFIVIYTVGLVTYYKKRTSQEK